MTEKERDRVLWIVMNCISQAEFEQCIERDFGISQLFIMCETYNVVFDIAGIPDSYDLRHYLGALLRRSTIQEAEYFVKVLEVFATPRNKI